LKQRLRSDQKLKLAVLSVILRPDPGANSLGVTFESFRGCRAVALAKAGLSRLQRERCELRLGKPACFTHDLLQNHRLTTG